MLTGPPPKFHGTRDILFNHADSSAPIISISVVSVAQSRTQPCGG
jgi:hypothetical protein